MGFRGKWRAAGFAALGAVAISTASAASFLFDNTKAETAGNADWVIDADANVPARLPTPAAAGITPATAENYWTGALSSWGVALVKRGHSVETLPAGGRITYGDATNAQDLANYTVYVICEPNVLFSAAEKAAIVNYVLAGGRLFLIGNHSGSDRNNDGADPPRVWNDLFDANGVRADPFGFRFNPVSVSLTSSLVDTNPANPLVFGPVGTVTALKYSAGATMTIHPDTHPGTRVAVWRTAGSNADAMAVYGTAGLGRFAAIGDSSPPDDGTGSPGNTLYPGWTELASHAFLLMNASLWLAESPGPANDAFANPTVVPNPEGAIALTGTNVRATREPGEPAHAGDAGGASVWWRFTAAASGEVTASTAGSGFDTTLAVYTGDTVGGLSPVAANDNADGATPTSAVTFAVTAGTVYAVAVDGHGGATGSVALALTLPLLPPPANDAFANAAPLPPDASTTPATNAHASREPGEPTHAGRAGGASVWWTWTAPDDARSVTIATTGSAIDTNLAVYAGDSLETLETLAADTDSAGTATSALRLTVTPGAIYRIAVDGEAGATGSLRLLVTPSPEPAVRPANDAFAAAAPLAGSSATASQSSDFATAESGEPTHAGSAATKSLWWSWTAVATGPATITTTGSNFNTTLSVHTGTDPGTLALVAENDDATATTTASSVAFTATAGTTYRIAVDGRAGASGSVALAVAGALPGPANDAFAGAVNIEGAALNATGTNVNATKETGEPSHAGNSGGKSVWWSWTAPATGPFLIDTVGSSFDTTLGVYAGTAVNALQTLAGNDDANGTNKSQLVLSATAGSIYRIAVDGYNAASGTVTLNINPADPPPANDAFAAAVLLPGNAPTASASSLAATAESSEPAHNGRTANHSIWWSWTAPADGYASVSTAGSNFDTVLAVYTGANLDALTPVASNDDANGTSQSQVSFAVTAGTTYRLVVDSYSSSAGGAIALAINGALPAPTFTLTATANAAEHPLVSGAFQVSLSISQPRATAIELTLNGTATPGVDYVPSLPVTARKITATIPPLQTSATVRLTPIPDAGFVATDRTIIPTLAGGASTTIFVVDATPYDSAWTTAAGSGFTAALSAARADPETDGVPNLLEYALNGNPLLPDADAILPVAGVEELPGPDGAVTRHATLTFLRRTPSSLAYTVTGSTNLRTWSAAGVVQTAVSADGLPAGFERVTVRTTAPIDPRAPLFLRLEVAWP